MHDNFQKLIDAFNNCPLVPVLTIDDLSVAASLAKAISRTSITTAEVTLRTPQALEAITVMKNAAPRLLVGAGTIVTPKDVDDAIAAGSDFLVTPAVSTDLLDAIKASSVPVFPGVATPSEALEMYGHGFEYVKFFPAEANGGVTALKSMAAPLPNIKFMPTGGINGQSAPKYLALPNVVAVGGSWMIDKNALQSRDFYKLTRTANVAVRTLQ